MFANRKELLDYVDKHEIQMLDFKVVDLCGRWRHMTYPTANLPERIFEEGTGISLSPYPGYRQIQQGDMKIVPDVTTAFVDPFHDVPALSLLTNIFLNDGTPYARDPRAVAGRAEQHLAIRGIGEMLWSPEMEFYVFDSVRYGHGENGCFFEVSSKERNWKDSYRSGMAEDGYYAPKAASGQCDMPNDRYANVRERMAQLIEQAGVRVLYHHHEVGGPGQMEIEVLFDTLLATADSVMIMKYVIKNVARQHGLTATFMPKPLYGEAGSGVHYHQYLSKDGMSLFYDKDGYAGLSDMALCYVGGLLSNTTPLMAITNAATNSYRRFGLGLAAPRYLTFAQSNRSSAVRIPGYAINEREARIEYRLPDATGNPYFSLAGMLLAGLKGIDERMDPMEQGFGPYDSNVYTLPEPEKRKLKLPPASFAEALDALRKDHDFLTADGVFQEELINAYVDVKFERDVTPMAERPHPLEYELYYDL